MAEANNRGDRVNRDIRRTSPMARPKSKRARASARGVSTAPKAVKKDAATTESAEATITSKTATATAVKEPEAASEKKGASRRDSSRGRSRGMKTFVGLIAGLVAVAIVAVVWVSALLTGGLASQEGGKEATRAEYETFARQMTLNLTSLNPENVDSQITRFRQNTSGKALQQWEQNMQSTVSMIKDQKVTTKSEILSSAVESYDDKQATVLLVYGWSSTSPSQPDPTLATFRWKSEITRINGEMKLTNFEWVF